ncbi:zinc finger transcription factor ace1 [Cucurbitaria berberidis CBS 394.84]|uniref:Zinc finger transcription factor ace1 n=1 Tax=Cucurbitaria berberidis CBS 394.84 TaxID=1168544 RepID=A0A9P4L336_9PLEO|nr:zinc finger transcription factor ace1 [Cucurbitaria berberidis CBS 394.84]KAF1839915.1 zinc finger transcription factor ace1 [Cucurbitaria berberidis CBS 394.84]
MSAPHGQNCHPRRRPIKGHVSPLSTHGMHLRKSGTFSSPKSLSNDLCDLENQHFMPRRSPTSTESLEELLQDSSVRRVANLLKDFDKKIAGHRAASATGANILNDPEVLPVPSFVLDNATLDSTPMDIDSKPSVVEQNPHEHASDSGLGSSISGSKYDDACTRRSSVRESINTSVSSTHSAVTRSFSALGASEEKHTLGEYACKQIHDTIIKPILAEESLKDFHPLIKDVPRRIGEKNICNLRDLEKTLIFLAPELSATATSYLRFCERSIQLLHTTVEYLSEQDQRLPSDRPYTNNYFLDLIEQIRRYAAIMAATRQKQEKGEELDEMDYSRDEKVTLRGGLSHNGRPVELVREKNGKVMPIAEDAEKAYKGLSKRALSDDDMDDDEVTRSMARRRKSEKPGDVMHACRDCKKEFKRPCDLTKHEKTHSRPWKCTEENCKYFDLGWPTEKERDRHMNDKHSAAPAQHRCLYPPCTYASKRESNCKQHMEKAHGWQYVRSKSNGRKRASANNDHSPTTPLTPFTGTPQSAVLTTPITPFVPSPQVPMIDTFDYYGFGTPALSVQGYQDDFRRDSVTTDGSHFTYSSGHSPTEPTSFDDAVTPEDTTINHNVVFNQCGLGANFNTGFQQPTPALSTTFDFEPLPFTSNSAMTAGLPHLSPMGQPDVTLFSPEMHMDEGFGDMDMQTFSRPTEDFTLFDTAPPSTMSFNNTANFFPDFNQVGGQFDTFYAEPTTTLDDLMGNNYGNPQ